MDSHQYLEQDWMYTPVIGFADGAFGISMNEMSSQKMANIQLQW